MNDDDDDDGVRLLSTAKLALCMTPAVHVCVYTAAQAVPVFGVCHRLAAFNLETS